MDRLAAETAHHIALIPFAVLVWRGAAGHKHEVGWWWLAVAFLVSWLADTAAHYVHPNVLSLAYPITQCALVGMVLLPKREAVRFLLLLCVTGMLAAVANNGGPDLILRTVAFGMTAGIVAAFTTGLLRVSLLAYFGGGLALWWVFVLAPSYESWLAYQATRVVGITLFCVAASRPLPQLRIA